MPGYTDDIERCMYTWCKTGCLF